MAKDKKAEAKQKVAEIVNKFNSVDFKKYGSSEFEIQIKFINELFEALGWDVRGKKDFDEVRYEPKVYQGRADYVFKIGGIPKFALEAKKISINIDDPTCQIQAVMYAYNMGLTYAALTNFKRLIVFNAEEEEKDLEKVKVLDLTCDEFVTDFDKLWWLSKEGINEGILDKEAEQRGAKKKRIPLGKQLFEDLLFWQKKLYSNIRKNNPQVPEPEIEENIQILLNRLIFIRHCEDKDYCGYVLKEKIHLWESDKKSSLMKSLQEIFRNFDTDYNSELFKERTLDSLMIDDSVIKEIIYDLYYSRTHSIAYRFDAIRADTLGNVYEQFLGNIQKRKAQGIYYTPTYIVDFIVRNTLGRLLNEKNVNPDKIKVLDPACGSGSFLIKATDYFIEFHKKKSDMINVKQQVLSSKGDEVSYSKKTDILTKNIFGVDVDAKAIDIARLNLLLHIARKKEKLPLLKENLKVGNSLIDDEKVAGDKAFKWEKEFKEIMQRGKFNVVIGNPPWGADIDDILDYLEKKYPDSTQDHKDSYKCFIEQGVHLLNSSGIIGYIVPSTCLLQPRYKDIRLFLKQFTLLYIINLGEKVFEEGTAPSCIIIVQNKDIDKKHKVKVLDLAHSKDNKYKSQMLQSSSFSELPQSIYDKTIDNNFVTFYRELKSDEILFGKIIDCRDAGINYQRVGVGMKEKGKSDLAERLLYDNIEPKSKYDKEFLKGEDLGRYQIAYKTGRFVRTNYSNFIRRNEVVHLDVKTYSYTPKLLWRQTADRPIATIDNIGAWFGRSIQAGILEDKQFDIKYLLALLNSKYFAYLYIQGVKEMGRVFPQVKLNKIKQLPVKRISSDKQQPFIKLVDKMLSLNKRLNEIGDKKTDARAKLEEEIKKIDTEIDELVYKIYGITEKEKRIIEESLK